MRVYTDEERVRAKAIAQEKFESTRCMEILIDAPIDVSVIVCPHDRASYAAYFDATAGRFSSAAHGATIARMIMPGLGELEKLRQAWPTFCEKVNEGLSAEAGATGEWATVARLDLAALPDGLEVDAASALVTTAKGRALWIVEQKDQGLSCIMETPLSDVWMAWRSSYDAALAAKTGIVAVDDAYIPASVRWSSQPLMGGAGLLDLKPALIQDLHRAYRRIGGDGAAVRTKSF